MRDIIVFGAGGHAKVIIDIVEKQHEFNIVGLIDPYRQKGEYHFGYTIIGNEEDYSILNKIHEGIVAIGDNWTRYKMVCLIKDINSKFKFITCIHPYTSIGKGVTIGDGSVLMAGAVVNSDSIIGNHCIINTKASIDHDNCIGDYASIAPNATTGGHVKIGDYSAIGLGANIIHDKCIGSNTVIGAGSTVIKDIPSYTVAYGIPCKIVRKRIQGEKYL
ncbi:acetyltransferase [Vallitalea guaymasensis]|uniref:acetyltransferase n=1 Tax=Vallitalea guaymasensis TaxID=1185412 RepID=UPI00272B404E|nr:acetyltransferase [Vallitalea guaymasensis]